VFVIFGYAFSRQLEVVAEIALNLGMGLLVLLLAALALYILWKYVQRQRFLRSLRVNRIDPEELKKRIDAGEEIIVVDLRHSMDFEADPNTIPGALFLPSEEFDKRHREIPADRELILFCT
ncbi:MAG TPA: rhodanese-like domain-containing protein, partial [Terriglobia bacterium]|nr:rhodanese-like domain-containing protein [Terriglobia bacterium]